MLRKGVSRLGFVMPCYVGLAQVMAG